MIMVIMISNCVIGSLIAMTMISNCTIGSSDKPTVEVSNFLLLLPRVLATTSGFAFYSIFFHFIRYSFIYVNVALRFHLLETLGG